MLLSYALTHFSQFSVRERTKLTWLNTKFESRLRCAWGTRLTTLSHLEHKSLPVHTHEWWAPAKTEAVLFTCTFNHSKEKERERKKERIKQIFFSFRVVAVGDKLSFLMHCPFVSIFKDFSATALWVVLKMKRKREEDRDNSVTCRYSCCRLLVVVVVHFSTVSL